jgi:hypothetical protein
LSKPLSSTFTATLSNTPVHAVVPGVALLLDADAVLPGVAHGTGVLGAAVYVGFAAVGLVSVDVPECEPPPPQPASSPAAAAAGAKERNRRRDLEWELIAVALSCRRR